MAITVTHLSTNNKLITRTRLKLDLGVTGVSDDQYYDNLIDEASDLIKSYTNRTFSLQSYTETLPSIGRTNITLENTPLIEIDEIRLNDSVISSTTYYIQDTNAGILHRDNGWTSTLLYRWYNVDGYPYPLNEAQRGWAVDYVAGYMLPGTTGTTLTTLAVQKLPSDLQRACLDLCKIEYGSRGNNPLVISQKVGDASETLMDPADFVNGIPPKVAAVLDNYKRFLT